MSEDVHLTVVIPVFDRAWCVTRALDSARAFLAEVGGGEIVVVDDGSRDDSVAVIERWIAQVNPSDLVVRLERQAENRGVCAARNAGGAAAHGNWLVFLDSDDELLPEAAVPLSTALAARPGAALHFFRCVDESGVVVGGDVQQSTSIGLDAFITQGTNGESLPVVRRTEFLRFRYDEDILGFEGLCYTRMVRQLGPAILHPLVARRYYTAHEGRLSSRAGVRRRARSLSRGYARMLREHAAVLGVNALAHLSIRSVYHRVRSMSA